MRMYQKLVIVTGAARGIGYYTARRFASEGANVILVDLDFKELEQSVEKIKAYIKKNKKLNINQKSENTDSNSLNEDNKNQQILPFEIDVQNSKSIEKLISKLTKSFKNIDVLINNAGIVRDSQLIKMQENDFDLVMNINLKGIYNFTRHIAPIMVNSKRGVILNTASIVGIYGNFGQTNYAASKAGVIAMTKVWSRELAFKGVRVNAVAPGFIQTPMTDGIPDKVIDKIVDKIPMRRMGKPEDIANAFLWLASDEASYVNGHVLSVDGGAVI